MITRDNSGLVVRPSRNGRCLSLEVNGNIVPAATVEIINTDSSQKVVVTIPVGLVTFADRGEEGVYPTSYQFQAQSQKLDTPNPPHLHDHPQSFTGVGGHEKN